ncbi:MAG: hypothetical protein ABEK29_02870, partial [Bradymonadaceae bacterium]
MRWRIPFEKPPARLSAAWVYLDGELILGPDDFDQDVDDARRTRLVPSGSHELRVKVASKPGAKLDVDVRASEVFTDTIRETTTGENGILEVTNVAVDHPMFSPNGDDYHDTALFNADNLPDDAKLNKSAYDYHLDWNWSLIDADSCDTVDAGLSGTTPVNSPTNVRAHWDGTTSSGTTVGDGSYLYEYQVDLVRSDGTVVDSATATARGVLVDSSETDYEPVSFDDRCDPDTDPNNCRCPQGTADGVRCSYTRVRDLEAVKDASKVDTGKFITTTKDPATGRHRVVVDLRSWNGGGLVPQHNARYRNLEELQSFISTLTGVPADPNDTRLFNFDYVQLGYSTPVVKEYGVVSGFNHFLLDAMTDRDGKMRIGGTTVDLGAMLDSGETPLPEGYTIQNPRTDEHCAINGNTDGKTAFRAKACGHVRTANLDPGGTNLGIYTLQSRMFDVTFDGKGTTRDTHCIINGIIDCRVRTIQRDAELTAAGTEYIESTDGTIRRARDSETSASGLPALVVHSDRHIIDDGTDSVLDGVCSKSVASGAGMSTRLDFAAGAVSPVCIINGII